MITFSEKQTHDLSYQGGQYNCKYHRILLIDPFHGSTNIVMVVHCPFDNAIVLTNTFFLRNKFCFTGGYIEAAVQLPGTNNVIGMWPAIWTMGNLGRVGYGATLEGMVCI